jgi:hypothetical protein
VRETRECPDGSVVHRAGPGCDFLTCPGELSPHERTLSEDPAPPIGPNPDPEPSPRGVPWPDTEPAGPDDARGP